MRDLRETLVNALGIEWTARKQAAAQEKRTSDQYEATHMSW
tara:strand:- start:736 stop:858 length:123 start_codon:yes stop_codon:yes gene_type:complete